MARNSSPTRTCKLIVLVLLLSGLLFAAAAYADKLTLKDGRTFEGRLISQNDSEVIFEAHMGRARAKLSFPPNQVAKIEKGEIAPPEPESKPEQDEEDQPRKPAVPACFVIPLKGDVGIGIAAKPLDECLKIAKNTRAAVVILQIDSGGGSVWELKKLLKTIDDYKDMRIVAYVDKAYSAAALLAMSCKEIIISPKGTIGGAVIFQIGPVGTPANIEEKWESIYRAEFRSAVTRAGHSELILEGMMSTHSVLSLKKTDKGVEVVKGRAPGTTVIKPAGRILTMTADEAVACGLAMGSAEKPAECNKLLNVTEWLTRDRQAQRIFDRWQSQLKKAEADYKKLMKETDHLWELAKQNHPSRVTLFVDSSGSLTEASKRNWYKYASICVQCLGNMEKNIEKLEKIAGEYFELRVAGKIRHSKESLQEARERITSMRQVIQSGPPAG